MPALLIVWLAGIICVLVMKKLTPDTYKAYAIYVMAIEIIFTVFVIHYLQG